MNQINSRVIAQAVAISTGDGNEVAEISEEWDRAQQVVFMRRPLTPEVKAAIEQRCPNLRYWRSERTPHNAPDEGFTCDTDRTVIVFPR
jgi:hypothetical protein